MGLKIDFNTFNNIKLLKISVLILGFVIICCLGFNVTSAAPINDSTIYVSPMGNDSWDGQSNIYNNTTGSGPKATITNATGTVANNGTVIIMDGIYNESNISLTMNMTIIGENQNNTIINGGDSKTIFIIPSNVNININDLTLMNGYNKVSGEGGGIYNNGILTLTNITFDNNTANYDGGAIANFGGTLTINNSIFINNTASDGGVIYNSGTLNDYNNLYTNDIGGYGGAIDNQGIFNGNDDIFTSNLAKYYGGAIYNIIGTSNITDTIFNNDSSTYKYGAGGAIDNEQGTLNLTSSSLTNNTAIYEGGAISNDGTATLNYNQITGNTANIGNNIYNDDGSMNAEENWWGTNNGPSNSITGFNITAWLLLTLNETTNNIINNGNSTLTAELLTDNLGNNLNPINGCLPNWIPVNFYGLLGSFNPQSTTLINGSATSLFTANTVGTTNLTATIDNQTITVPMIIEHTTNLTLTAGSGFKGETVNISANLTDSTNNAPINNAIITFTITGDSNLYQTVTVNGIAILNYTIMGNPGLNTVTAYFMGNDQYNNSTGTTLLTITLIPTNTITGDTNDYAGQTINLITQVNDYYDKPVDEGSVNFTVDNTDAGTVPVIDGVAETNWTIPLDYTSGNYTIIVNYQGTINYLSSNNTSILTVTPTPTITTVSNVNNYAGENVTLTANVNDIYGNPLNTGQIQFTVNNTNIGTISVINGVAGTNWTIPLDYNTGNYIIQANYQGTSNYLASNNTAILTVDPTPTITAINNNHNYAGENVTLTANVNDIYGNPINTGQLQFTLNNTIINIINMTDGQATTNWIIPTNWNVGNYTIQANYQGTNNYLPSNNTAILTVDPILNINSINPVNNAVNVSISNPILVNFSENIKAGSEWIVLTKNNESIPINISINDNILTITPVSKLNNDTVYNLTLHTDSLTSLNGDPSRLYTMNFSTGPDPTVKIIYPVNGAVNVTSNLIINITFNENIKPGNNYIQLLSNNGTNVPFTESIQGNILIIKPESKFTNDNLYTLILHTGSILDIADNPLVLYKINFSIGPDPTVKSVNPVKNAVNVPLNEKIKITFNENIKTGNNNIILETSKGIIIPLTVSINSNVLTLTPETDLTKGTKYTLILHSNSITDLSDNPLTLYTTDFTTI